MIYLKGETQLPLNRRNFLLSTAKPIEYVSDLKEHDTLVEDFSSSFAIFSSSLVNAVAAKQMRKKCTSFAYINSYFLYFNSKLDRIHVLATWKWLFTTPKPNLYSFCIYNLFI